MTNPTSTEPNPGKTAEEIFDSFERRLQPVRKSPLYFIGTTIVAVAMVILPIAYLCLVALVAYGVYYHATRDTFILTGSGGGKFRFLAYVAPLFAGAVVVVFMIKPLFARPPKRPPPFSIDTGNQRLLFGYIRRLSALTGSPAPRRIDLNCDVNASAGFRRGLLSMIGNDLVLTIGLPLVEGMTIRQFTGVLAHELGHFSQGGAMRLSYIIRSVNHWFARVVFERDNFDIALEKAAASGGLWWWQLILAVARGAVWLTRRILWMFMTSGNVISCFLLRQMEYDADRYEARISGSAEFEKTAIRLMMLTAGQRVSSTDLQHFWVERRLPDQYPQLIAHNADRISEESKRKIWDDVLARPTGKFDTHPSQTDRIRSAMAEAVPGLVQEESQARILFNDYQALAVSVTESFYRNVLRIPQPEKTLTPTSQILAARDRLFASYGALNRFFQGQFNTLHFIVPSQGPAVSPGGRQGLLDDLVEIRREISKPLEKDAPAAADHVRRRFDLALRLLVDPELSRELADAGCAVDRDEIVARTQVLAELAPVHAGTLRLNEESSRLVQMIRRFEANREDKAFVTQLRDSASRCWELLHELRSALRRIHYPYAHLEEESSCEKVAIPAGEIPPIENIGAIAESSMYCVNALFSLYSQIAAEVAAAAERSEAAIGFPPLPNPPGEKRPPI